MVTYCVTKITPTCSPVIGQFLIPSLWHQLIKSDNYDPSKSVSWKVLKTVLSHLKFSRHVPINLTSLFELATSKTRSRHNVNVSFNKLSKTVHKLYKDAR